MAIYALIADDRVVNLVEWDGIAPFAPPTGTAIMPIANVADDDAIAGGGFLPDAGNA